MDKFIPQSPDPCLQQEADMSLAKFGHINKIVDQVTTNEAAITNITTTQTATNYAEVVIDNTNIASMSSGIVLLPALTAGDYYIFDEIIIESTAPSGNSVTQNSGNSLYLIEYSGSVVGFVNRYAFDYNDPSGSWTKVPLQGQYAATSTWWGGDVVVADQSYNNGGNVTMTTDNGLDPSAVSAGCGALVKIRYRVGTFGSEL